MEIVPTDGSPEAAARLGARAAAAVAGDGPAVLPTGPGGPVPSAELAAPVDDAVAAVVTTTGSSGAPKAVLLPAASLHASAGATDARLGPPGRWLLALPAHHVAGLQVLLRSSRAGIPAAVMDLRDGFRPEAFATTAADAGADYTSLVPTQLVRLLDAGGAALDALRSFTAVLLGGAAADPVLLVRARTAGVPVVTTYGMSETCGGCVYEGRPL
ncbi:MAG: O-succinylbenzoic acid--CoA ligase, partial [Actinomycetospora sp.]|nr:O-succinylbenzoic acid--CoA ligase [Actinomycetospora sp.]